MSGKGKRLESIVRKAAKSLADRQIARIYRWAESVTLKMIPQRCRCGSISGVSNQVVHTEAPGADFWGFSVSGRVVVIECKEAFKPSLALGAAGLKPHQVATLTEVHRSGGIALLVWARGPNIAVIDVDILLRISAGRQSIPWDSIPEEFIHQEDDIDNLLRPYLPAF